MDLSGSSPGNRTGEVQSPAFGIVTAGPCDYFLIQCMLLSCSLRRIVINHKETLLANMIDKPLRLSLMIVSFYQSQIEHGSGRSWNDVASQRADVAAAYAVDVQRRLID